jgi:hypothetical protein
MSWCGQMLSCRADTFMEDNAGIIADRVTAPTSQD